MMAPAATGLPRLRFCICRRNSALMKRRHGEPTFTAWPIARRQTQSRRVEMARNAAGNSSRNGG